MGTGKPWTRDELLLALHLYERIEFGKQHSGNPEVVALAKVLGRTPGSVSMKLNNLTSLDPAERERGVVGLPGASAKDKEMWDEFRAGIELPAEAESPWAKSLGETAREDGEEETVGPIKPFMGAATESRREGTVRRAQAYFRRVVLAIYGKRCCITGMPVPSLLTASHIVPWAKDPLNRVNPSNGLCLTRTHDAAFEVGLITFDEKNRLVVGKRLGALVSESIVESEFAAFEGKALRPPVKYSPDPAFLAYHREKRFKG